MSGGDALVEAATQPGFDEVYRRHAASVLRFCLSQAGDRPLAEDLTHETFLRAYAAWERVRPEPDSVRAWLLSIARNLLTDHHRRHGRWRRILGRLASAAPADDLDALVDRRDRLRHVNSTLATLGRRDRELIGLRVAAGLSYREMAALLRSTEPAVKVATHRALNRLRSRLETTR